MAPSPVPELCKSGHAVLLHVDGRPFLAIGGELGNSNASDLAVLETALVRCRRMNLNTVMLPVYWDLIEPTEGAFDFSLVRGAIDLARANGLRLVPLWFGTWKNSMSCYAPGWVKRDTTRFERARRGNGEAMEIISPLSMAVRDADAQAFAALMRWIKSYDEQARTIIMVQVENEIGMIPEARDHSPVAERAYRDAVPATLLSLTTSGQLGPEVGALWEKAGRRTSGSWAEVFGDDATGEEIFSAWQFATFVEQVTAAGKAEYALPMFTNAALIRPGYLPGQYPSAGPLPHLLEVWRAGAPSLDMLCPDIYFPNFIEWCGRYVRSGNPLFIPEMAASLRAPANALFAIAHFNAIGVGPFSIENIDAEKEQQIGACFKMLSELSDLILTSQAAGTIIGLSPHVGFDWSIDEQPQRGTLGDIVFEAKFDRPSAGGDLQTTTLPTLGAGRWDAPPGTPLGAAMIIQLAPEEFLVAGSGVTVTFAPVDGTGRIGIERVQEGCFTDDGTWFGGRWLNGDETHQGRHIQLPGGRWTMQRVSLYRYE
jgi:beta-galactosidase GanA